MVEPDTPPDDNTAHARCMLYIGYRYIMRICNTHCFSTCFKFSQNDSHVTTYVLSGVAPLSVLYFVS